MKKFEIFARKDGDEALTRVGAIEIEEGASVEDAAKEQHGGDWLEMVAIPADSMSWAIGGDDQ